MLLQCKSYGFAMEKLSFYTVKAMGLLLERWRADEFDGFASKGMDEG